MLFSCSENEKDINFFVENKSIKILFLGGSVTEGAGASNIKKRYANMLDNYLKKIFPLRYIITANYGLGSTTSTISCFINDALIEESSPDLVFIDYTVNDGNSDIFLESYEGLIRKIIRVGAIPIPILLTRKNNSSSKDIHLKVIDHYKLPMVDMTSIFTEIADKDRWHDYFVDDVHPNDQGHRLIADEILYAGLTNLVSAKELLLNRKPLTDNRYETTNYFDAESIDLNRSINFEIKVNEKFKKVLSSKGGYSEIRFTTKAENIGIIFEKGPLTKQFTVRIDEIEYHVNANASTSIPFFRYWSELSSGIHEMKIKTSDEGLVLAGIGTF